MTLPIKIVAYEPTNTSSGHDVSRKVPAGSDTGNHHGRCESISQEFYKCLRVFMCDHRGKRPGIDGVAGWETGVPAADTFLKTATAIILQGPRSIGSQFQHPGYNIGINQRLERDQSRFPQPLVVTLAADKVEAGADRNERVG